MSESPEDFDAVYDGPDAEEVVVIRMTRRQWWHLDDWRATHPDRYPKRAAQRNAAWAAIEVAKVDPAIEVLRGLRRENWLLRQDVQEMSEFVAGRSSGRLLGRIEDLEDELERTREERDTAREVSAFTCALADELGEALEESPDRNRPVGVPPADAEDVLARWRADKDARNG